MNTTLHTIYNKIRRMSTQRISLPVLARPLVACKARRGWAIIALCTIGGGVSSSYAQALTLPQCLSLAAEHNLTLRQAGLQVDRARTMQGTAWDVDKTGVSLSQDPTSGGSPDNALAVSQTIEFPTVYAARHGQLKAETRAEESRRNVTAQQVRADITAAYWQLVYNQERMRVLMAQDSLLARYAAIADKRYKAGEARQLEALTAARMQRENRMELSAAESDYAAGQHRLAALIGIDTPVAPSDTRLAPLAYQPHEYVYAATAEGELAYNQLVVADKALRVAKNGYAPSLSVALKNQLVITGWDPYHENRSRYKGGNFMGFEVGIGIPLFFGTTKAKVKAARQDREIAETAMHQQQQSRQKDYDAAMAQYTAAFNRMRYYNGQGTADASEIARLGTVEYENGEITYIEYVNALQESIDAKLKQADATNGYNQAVVALKRITGEI